MALEMDRYILSRKQCGKWAQVDQSPVELNEGEVDFFKPAILTAVSVDEGMLIFAEDPKNSLKARFRNPGGASGLNDAQFPILLADGVTVEVYNGRKSADFRYASVTADK